jgi:hypothetical protein
MRFIGKTPTEGRVRRSLDFTRQGTISSVAQGVRG